MIVMEYNYSHLICFSPTHSSHLIGESILREIRTELWEETDLTYEEPHQQLTIRDAVAIVVVPVYAGRVAETALERMKNICGENSIAIPVVVYGNRDYDDALLELTDWCRQHGFMPFAAAAFIGALTAGILASVLKSKIGYPRISLTVPSIVIMVPGLYLYRAIYNLGVMSLQTSASWFAAAILIILALPLGLIFARILTDKTFRYCT